LEIYITGSGIWYGNFVGDLKNLLISKTPLAKLEGKNTLSEKSV
jgi:hypothetical protein